MSDNSPSREAPAVSPVPASIPSASLWPMLEFRPLPELLRGIVVRYAEGAWLPDDGEYDLSFIAYGAGVPRGIYIDLPYQRNIIWSGLTSHWSAKNYEHPRCNPWHYLLREGASDWGGDWGHDSHPNYRAGRAAMSECCRRNRCANGTGPKFEDGDKHILAGLVRERETKRIITPPAHRVCMFCGGKWELHAQAIEARRAETGTGSVHESAVPQGCAQGDRL